MSDKLALHPSYNHQYQQSAPKTTLFAETAHHAYLRLHKFLGMQNRACCPTVTIDKNQNEIFWAKNNGMNHRSLFHKNGFHHPVCWMPNLKKGWVRMSYQEFCWYYGIQI